MSKMDNLRAMREARFERSTQSAKAGPAKARPSSRPDPAVRTSAQQEPPQDLTEEATEELCGHRAISGRTCTRERGHAAKSHRYG